MNKKLVLLPLSVFVVTLFSCNYQLPEKISVKTNANYSFSVGEFKYPSEKEAEDGISLYSVLEEGLKTSDSSALGNIEFFDYNPELQNKYQQLGLKVPIQQLDMDFSEYLDQVDLESYLTEMKMDYDIEIPEFSGIKNEQSIDGSLINDAINKVIIISAAGGINDLKCDIYMDGDNNFSSVTYESGYLDIRISDYAAPNTPINGTITIDGSEVTVSNGTASYDISGKPINRDSGLHFDTSNLSATSYLLGTIRAGSKIEKIEGLTLSPSITPTFEIDEISFDAGNDSALKECIVKKGKVKAGLEFPSTWENIVNGTEITITQGLKKDNKPVKFTAAAPEVDLNGAIYQNGKISVKPTISLGFRNSTITFAENPKFVFAFTIETLESIKIALGSDLKLDQSIEMDLPAEALNILKSVAWNKAGINVAAVNMLPAGNPISIKISSNFMGMNEVTQTIESGVQEEQKLYWGCPENYVTKIGSGAGESKKIDFKAEIILPNYNNGILTLNNVSLGEKYKIKFTANAEIDWKAITIDNNAAAVSGSNDIQLNIAEQLKSIDKTGVFEKLNLNSLPIYVYCDVGDLNKIFDNPSISGQIKISSGKYEGSTFVPDLSKTTYLLGSEEDDDAKMVFESLPEFEKNEDGTYKTVTKKITGGLEKDLSTLLGNILSGGEGLGVDYRVKFSTGNSGQEITLEKENIKNAGKVMIDLSAILILPFDFNISEDIKIDDVLALVGVDNSSRGENWDLLNRKSENDMEELKNYIDIIQKVELDIKNIQIPLNYTDTVKLVIDLDGSQKDEIEKLEFALSSKNDFNISLSPSQILDIYPLQPEVSLVIPKGNFSLDRILKVSGAIDVKVKMDGNKSITIWDQNATNNNGNNR